MYFCGVIKNGKVMENNKYEYVKIDNVNISEEEFGYLVQDTKTADKYGKDPNTGLHRTGLEKYLNAIFPNNKFEYQKRLYTGELTKNGRKCFVKLNFL